MPTEALKDTSLKTCSGDFGKQLKAVFSDGRPYVCAFGKKCKFKHVSKIGKTKQEVVDIVARLPTTAKADLTKALEKKA